MQNASSQCSTTPLLHHSFFFMSREYWESRYQSGDMHWDKGALAPVLEDFLAAGSTKAR